MSAGGGCEAAMTARTGCWWVELRECVDLLCEGRFPIRLNGAAYRSYVRSALMYESEA